MREISQIDESTAPQAFKAGKSAYLNGQYDLAKLHFSKVKKENPDYDLVDYYLGIVCFRLKRHEEALQFFSSYLDKHKDSADTLDAIGLVYLNSNDLSSAEAFFTQAIGTDATFFSPRHNRGLLYFTQEKFNEAIADLMQALTLELGNPYVLHTLANCYDKMKQYALARECYEKAMQSYREKNLYDPDLHQALKRNYAATITSLGHEKYKGNDYAASADLYQQALKFDAENIVALNQFGMCQYKKQAYDKAGNAFLKMITIDEQDPDAWNNLACTIKSKEGNFLSLLFFAKSCIKRALELTPEDEDNRKENRDISARIIQQAYREYKSSRSLKIK